MGFSEKHIEKFKKKKLTPKSIDKLQQAFILFLKLYLLYFSTQTMSNGTDDILVQTGQQRKHLRVDRTKKSGKSITSKRGRT